MIRNARFIGSVRELSGQPSYMIFIYKITEVKVCISLRKYRDVTLAANETSAYAQCSQPHRKLILTAMQLKFSQVNLKMMAIQKIEKKTHFIQNYSNGPFFAVRLIYKSWASGMELRIRIKFNIKWVNLNIPSLINFVLFYLKSNQNINQMRVRYHSNNGIGTLYSMIDLIYMSFEDLWGVRSKRKLQIGKM